MIFRIYQIKNIKNCDYAFLSWESAEEKFTIGDYEWQYDGMDNDITDDISCLEDLFVQFNLNRPDDFHGHSLSVSDVVALKTKPWDDWRWYYCDRFGWKDITVIINK